MVETHLAHHLAVAVADTVETDKTLQADHSVKVMAVEALLTAV
jgi:hypothetical protein